MTEPAALTRHGEQPALNCFGVTIPCLPGYWAEAWALLEPAAARNGLYTKDSILGGLVRGEFQLWIAETDEMVMAALTEIADYPGRRVASVVLLGGNGLDRALPFLDVIEAWARENGCHRFVNEGRGGLAKKLEKRGYWMESIRMVKDWSDA